MKETFEVEVELRKDVGKGASRRLRSAGMVPVILYGGDEAPLNLMTEHNTFAHHLENEAFYSHILSLKLDGKVHKAVLKDLQRHPSKPFLMHADFQRASGSQVLRMHVPLHFLGEDVAPGVKAGGQISHNMIDVEVSCMAKDLPEYIEVDLSQANLGDVVHLSDLKIPAGVEILAMAHGEDADLVVSSVHATHLTDLGDDEAPAEGAEGAAEPAKGED